jgi:glycosyltransferase involved in cell wall biosynthesis
MRVTVVAFLFPPINQVGYKRPLRLVDHLRREGHDVTVYAVSPTTPQLWNYTGVDSDLERLIPPGVRVVRSPSIHGVKGLIGLRDRLRGRQVTGKHGTEVKAAQVTTAKSASPSPSAPGKASPDNSKPGSSSRSPVAKLRSMVDWVQGWCETPDPYIGWLLTALPGLLMRSLLRRPDMIYVTAPPWTPTLVAVLAGKILRIPVHADFRDPWATNKYWKAKKVASLLEAWVLKNSASVIANTHSMGETFLGAYPSLKSRLSVIYNGYEAETAALMGSLREKLTSQKRRNFFTVTHIGMLYPNRMPQALAACLARVAADWKGSRPLRIRFVGNVMNPAPLLEEFGRVGCLETLEFTGEVKTALAREEEVLADVLLLLQSGTREQVPAKVFEYAFAGNPILCVADAGSETARLVGDFGLGEVLHGEESPEEWGRRLEGLERGSSGSWVVPERFLQEFDGGRLAAKMFKGMLAASH